MVALSMLPIGILQANAAIGTGVWWARSAEFLQTPLMQNLRWFRAIGDTVFAIGALMLAYRTQWLANAIIAAGATLGVWLLFAMLLRLQLFQGLAFGGVL